MAHEAYGPVGYIYQADQYCLDCIPVVAGPPATTPNSRSAGYTRTGCNCTECRLDRMAEARGIDRYDESSFDSSDFPKAIPYHNDLHAECGPKYYDYGPEDPEWREQYCGATCAKCHAVIDGTSYYDGNGPYEDKCPAWVQRAENDFADV